MNTGTISILSALAGVGIGAMAVGKVMVNNVNSRQQLSDKHLALFRMMNQWVRVKQEGKNLSQYFEANNYKKIAVYGMSFAGETLISELHNTRTNVKYGIDKRAEKIYSEIPIITMEEELEEVDVVVVTAITFFDEIKEMLQNKIDCPIISLEDVLYEI